jgi:hypothetical protein
MPLLTQPTQHSTVVIGKENTGKSQLIASLTGRSPYSTNFRGSTIACETYAGDGVIFVDTPGILYRSDTATTRVALENLQTHDTVLLMVKATHIDEDLTDLLPLVAGKRGTVVITFWDKVLPSALIQQVLWCWQQTSDLAFIPVDARHLTVAQHHEILRAMHEPSIFLHQWQPTPVGWHLEPHPTLLEHPRVGWLLAIALLLIPAVLAVWFANTFAAIVDPLIQGLVSPRLEALSGLPSLPKEILIGRYGLVTMGPLLFVWAVPTVILYALYSGCLQSQWFSRTNYHCFASIVASLWLIRAGFSPGNHGVWLQRASRDQHSRLFQLFPQDLYFSDRLWFCLFLPIRCDARCVQCGESVLPGHPLLDLPDAHNVDLCPTDCAKILSFSPKPIDDRASHFSGISPLVSHLA